MTLAVRQPRPKKCQNAACGNKFVPQRLGQRVCSPACALATKDVHAERARKAIAQRERRELKARKEKLKSRRDYLREAQQAVNAYIRLRDKDQPCISCQRHHDGQYHAGHYRPAGSNPALRFEECNIWKQCQPCNTHLSGNLTHYRINLIQKIGLERVEWLEGPHDPKRFTIDELKAIKAKYRALVRELKKGEVA
ncbi:recombination protein NinG [Metapseudomonas sp. CR1201]